ncbi:MAG: HEAT repeat domain-containing protein, partial [Planctomycetia bacterium]|nr:HEAT repeat domain-containing protein [Planctomycetia bacterium]
DMRALEPLLAALEDEQPEVRGPAARALGKLRDSRAVELLIAALKDENPSVRQGASEALGRIKDARAVELLIPLLKDEHWFVRHDAAKALGEIKDPRAIGPLIDAVGDKEFNVQSQALEALRSMTKKDFGENISKWRQWWRENRSKFLKPAKDATQPAVEAKLGEAIETQKSAKKKPLPKPHAHFYEYVEACRFLFAGGPRDEASKRFLLMAKRYPDSTHSSIAGELGKALAEMAKEDRQFREPDDVAALPEQKRIRYFIHKLRDVAETPDFVPGKCRVVPHYETHGSPVLELRKMGKPIVPVLISVLEDSRPTRSFAGPMNGEHILRYSDVALQIIEAIANREFDKPRGRGAYLANADERTRAEIIARVKTWWQKNKSKTEAQWIRESLRETGFETTWHRHTIAERLVDLEGAKTVGFLRKRLETTPENSRLVRLLWRAGGKSVLKDIRPKVSSKNLYVRAAAYKILLEVGEPGIVEMAIQDLKGVLQHPERDYRRTLLYFLARSGREKGVLAAAKSILHRNGDIAKDAILQFQYVLRPKSKLSPELQRLVFAYMGEALEKDDLKYLAGRWIAKAAELPIEWPHYRAYAELD